MDALVHFDCIRLNCAVCVFVTYKMIMMNLPSKRNMVNVV